MENEILQIKTDSIESIVSSLGQMAVDFGIKIIAAILILIFGIWLGNRITLGLKKFMEKKKVEGTLQSFLLSFINIVLKVFVFIIVLTTVGVQMTSIIAVLGAASLAIGMALSGTLQNFAGGMVILMFKPFKVGDVIEISTGQSGVVKKIMIFTTEIRTFDNEIIFVPNSLLSNNMITNLSRGDIRRTDVSVGVSYGTDVEKVRKILTKLLQKNEKIIQEKTPEIFVSSLADSSVVLTLRYWTKYVDLLAVKAELLESIYNELPKNKIDFPFQQFDIRILK